MSDALLDTQKEVSRLSQNTKALFDLLPDMLLIITGDLVVERMNAAAVSRFGDQHGKTCYRAIFGLDHPCGEAMCPFNCQNPQKQYGELLERKISDDFFVEYSYVPFEGYRDDNLILLVMREVTQKKLHEMEIERYNKNIEKVLEEKIALLRKNETQRRQLHRELNYLKKETERFVGKDKMMGESKPIQKLRDLIYQVAPSDATILITGESGTGKELVADLVHRHSGRADKRYLKFNCSAVAESLLESDLFGYEKGAFTGAQGPHKGKFEEADGGTIFLDEIGDVSPKMQTSLLRVLQEGEIFRVGSNRPTSVDVRIIAATNKDLSRLVEAGIFREDLYYRLNVFNLYQVPLRKRKDDIVLLAINFLVKFRERFNKQVTFLPDSVVEKMLAYDWPGNVRELENAMQRAVLLSRNGIILPNSLGIKLKENESGKEEVLAAIPVNKFLDRPLKESVSFFEAEVISHALEAFDGKTDIMCRYLNLSKTALYEKMKRYSINPKDYKK
ncbi:MAG: sigma-54 dependent transcriptional regulator [Desulfobacterales bacterium]|nr:sigma-54 dependent transcriptional regulator [Desulfobacterales bacterium]